MRSFAGREELGEAGDRVVVKALQVALQRPCATESLQEFDEFLLDAIPEGPLLVTFHKDVPGVLGIVGTILGEEHINISRMQLGNPPETHKTAVADATALGIWNLEQPLTDRAIARIREQDPIVRACLVR